MCAAWIGTQNLASATALLLALGESPANGKPLSESNRPKTNNTRTLDVAPNLGEMVKPAELIEVKGASRLTLADRRLFNVLLRHAFGPDLASENRRFEIAVADLRETHESNDRLVQSIEALMTTVVTIQRPDGSTDRVQLLGWNNLSDPKRKRGNLKYSIPPDLALLLKAREDTRHPTDVIYVVEHVRVDIVG